MFFHTHFLSNSQPTPNRMLDVSQGTVNASACQLMLCEVKYFYCLANAPSVHQSSDYNGSQTRDPPIRTGNKTADQAENAKYNKTETYKEKRFRMYFERYDYLIILFRKCSAQAIQTKVTGTAALGAVYGKRVFTESRFLRTVSKRFDAIKNF